jgi:preprotein translocase subunit SecD
MKRIAIAGPTLLLALLLSLAGCSSAPTPSAAAPDPKRPTVDIRLAQAIIIDSGDIISIEPGMDGSGSVLVTVSAAATGRLAATTAANIGKPMAIYIDGKLISSPIIRDRIRRGRFIIGGVSPELAGRLAEAY